MVGAMEDVEGALHVSSGFLVTEAHAHPAREGQMLLTHTDWVQMWGEGEERRALFWAGTCFLRVTDSQEEDVEEPLE